MNKSAFETAMSQFEYFTSQLTTEQRLLVLARMVGRTVRDIRGLPFPQPIEFQFDSCKRQAAEILETGGSPLVALAVSAELLKDGLSEYLYTISHKFTPGVPGASFCELCGRSQHSSNHNS